MKSRRSRSRTEEPLDDIQQSDEDRSRPQRPPKNTRGKRRKLPWLFLLALALIALLPTIVGKTPLRDVVISAAMPTSELRVSTGRASLSWFRPPSIEEVRVRNSAGEPLLDAEAIRIDRSPGNLLLDSHNLGEIEIVRPSIYLKLRPDGNNIEDALRKALAELTPSANSLPDQGAVSRPVTLAVRVVDGTIFAEDDATGRRWRVQSINLNYYTHGVDNGIGYGQLSGQLAEIDANNAVVGTPGQFACELQAGGDKQQQLTLNASGLSLGLADALVRRYVAGSELSGTLSGQGAATWTANGHALPTDLTSSGGLAIERLDATAPALLGDRLKLSRVELPWRVAAQPNGISIEDLQLRSELGEIAVRGTLNGTLESAADQALELRGSLDLAQLATMLPRALRIRSNTTITSGQIQFAARSQPADGGQLVTGSLQTTQLTAVDAGRPIRWDQPVSAKFAVRRQPAGIRLDALTCDSDFLKIDASGTPQQLTASAQFDLNRLAEQLGQFVNLGGVALAGTGTAKLDVQQPAPDQLSATASGDLAQLRIGIGESQLAAGQGNFAANFRKVGSTIDVSDARLLVTDLRATRPGWNVNEPRAELAGDVHWNSASGELSASTAQLVTSALSAVAKEVRYVATQSKPGEPAIGQLTGMAAFRGDLARLAAWLAVPQQTPAFQPSGDITGQARFVQQGGRLSGEITASGQNLALAQLTASNANAPSGRDARAPGGAGYQTIWQEPQATFRALATYEPQSDRLAFEQFQIQSNTLQASASGHVESLSAGANIQMNGTVDYDLAQLTPLLRPYLGDGVRLDGREQAKFALAGQLNDGSGIAAQAVSYSGPGQPAVSPSTVSWARRVRAQVQVPWSGANVYGLPVGAGKLSAALADGQVQVEPLALAVGDGQLTAAPNIRLDPPPSELTLPRGPVLTNVRISPAVSEAMLKYVAPVLAGATQSEGQFSLALDGARVPLGEPKQADAGGQLTVHSVRVVPGPMAQQLVGVAQQIESLIRRRDPNSASGRPPVTLLSINDQQVNFRVVDGRVHHQNMEFQIGDVTLRSQGSVGLDETVALTLFVPVQDAWVAKEPLLAGFKGQSLQIPISGTLSRPQMDQRAIASLTQQLLQGAAQQAIGGELNKALDKLLKPRK